jgi:hypothetical protein
MVNIVFFSVIDWHMLFLFFVRHVTLSCSTFDLRKSHHSLPPLTTPHKPLNWEYKGKEKPMTPGWKHNFILEKTLVLNLSM